MNFQVDNIDNIDRADYLLELGKARALSGNYIGSNRLLEEASSLFLAKKEYSKYMESVSTLLKIYTELQDHEKIRALREELMEVTWEGNVAMTARTYYILATTSMDVNDLDQAYMELEKSMHQSSVMIQKARESKSQSQLLNARIESIFPIYGMASYYFKQGNLKKATQELQSLEDLITSFKLYKKQNKDTHNGDLSPAFEEENKIKDVLKETASRRERAELSSQVLKAAILRKQGRYVEAEKLLWLCYERVQKSKDLCTIVSFFYYLGRNYMDMQEYNQASVFLNLAKKSIDTDNFKHLHSHVTECLEELKNLSSVNFDLIVNGSTNSIVEKHKGRVDFKNQFILLDLLKMFLSKPGVSYSKEDLVEQVWKQKYDPSVHDNKIYVTIKRLRELVEPDCHRPRYIFRSKDGYYLNGSAKVLFKDLPKTSLVDSQELEKEIIL